MRVFKDNENNITVILSNNEVYFMRKLENCYSSAKFIGRVRDVNNLKVSFGTEVTTIPRQAGKTLISEIFNN